jgi:signal transduction histidine kinase
MDLAQDAAETQPPPRRGRLGWSADNPLVRAVGRVRLPLGAKLIAGFGLVAALLAVGYALGVSALGQSNSRSQELRLMQQNAVYEQLLVSDATQLKNAIDNRVTTAASDKGGLASANRTVGEEAHRLCDDADLGGCVGPTSIPALPLQLSVGVSVLHALGGHPALTRRFLRRVQEVLAVSKLSNPAHDLIARIKDDADWILARLAAFARQTTTQADTLVAADRGSFENSRNLLIGLGSGSLALALALGLLLSWSVVAPLRRTEERLSEIGAGDFERRLEVANRDEIGRLAARVNSTSDELQRVYRELELVSEHKSQFLANMSHELRTPLNAIIGFSEVLHEQMFGELNERQLAYLDDVLAAGRHLLSLINDVLDLAKIEAGRMELELSQVALPDVLRSAVAMHAERAHRCGVELSLQTEPEQITVEADERRLRQIVFNLLSNAVKFTPADGRIDVSARLDDGRVEIAVADTGPGIAADELESIFEEFEQTSTGKQTEGTGLGLPLSRKLAELHGGRLWAESEPGRGSTFRFILPLGQETEE